MHLDILESEIYLYNSVIPNVDELIFEIEDTDYFLNENTSLSKWKDWYASGDAKVQYGWQKNLKRSNSQEEIDLKCNFVFDTISNAFNECIFDYINRKSMSEPFNGVNKFVINKYMPGAEMGPHTDSYNGVAQEVRSVLLYLNDDYEGGEIEFPNHGIKIKPKAGSILIFPPLPPYTHIAHVVKSNNKWFVPGFWEK